MNKYYVIGPLYEHRSSSYYDPPEWGHDVVEVEAVSRSKAKAIGLRQLRMQQAQWLRDIDGNPFSKLKVMIRSI